MTTESDRELLELAAKAAGVFMTPTDWPYSDPITPEYFALEFDEEDGSVTGTRVWYGSNGDVGGTEKYTWRPLTDDGDALRLAVKLHINITCAENFSGAKPFYGGKGFDFPTFEDPYEATRRAIVRAAAEVARATHKERA